MSLSAKKPMSSLDRQTDSQAPVTLLRPAAFTRQSGGEPDEVTIDDNGSQSTCRASRWLSARHAERTMSISPRLADQPSSSAMRSTRPTILAGSPDDVGRSQPRRNDR